jgi:hypothetical protein
MTPKFGIFPCIFACYREFQVEKGSHVTASSAMQSQLQRYSATLSVKYA